MMPKQWKWALIHVYWIPYRPVGFKSYFDIEQFMWKFSENKLDLLEVKLRQLAQKRDKKCLDL